ncbi:hypothetical protein LTR10_022976 [Elasticomyces elasticus]|uniref:2EXR domain-containing protein n=1 Tax=Exophiala sideris TaxID=1016849 RepID=A0ABR0JA85_9EURO|nr:hypothetical protein LTR10_022976 [Elasticomyces elasticus]KAK5022164.1 hypothetical protein LTS07_010243 [Exophiala sideris]KAK5037395.1 hypothetical protein LTR13_004552 [Exophiala sideris]KAK5059057.1 hypothetical protein LTR69_006346 [Exophiala sideris]KAK5182890.1 hypothetical protein LTR44_004600 [Eurotiomycetes sp. CCFEE 6388]
MTQTTLPDNKQSAFLNLPAEIRNLIYKFALEQPEPLHLRCPSQRRLRPSRPSEDDARAFLDTCRLIRSEAITLYYSLNALVFRSTEHILAFVADPDIHPLIKSSLTHIAVDFGDSTDADAILKDHISLVDSCVGSLPRLKALETRFYARTLDACSSSHFRTLALAFDGLDADMNAPPPPRVPRSPRRRRSRRGSVSSDGSTTPSSTCSSPCPEDVPAPELILESLPQPQPVRDMSEVQAEVLEQYCFNPSAALAFATSKLKFSVAASSYSYPPNKHDKLICYNLRISADGVRNALGPAKEAVEQRLSRVGTVSRRLSDLYDIAADGGFHQRVRATLASCSRIDVGVS